jgi:site-specific recombinase XerC
MRAAICHWHGEGVSVPKVSARWLLIRSAVSWAVAEGLLRLNPLAGMRGPPRHQPRRHYSHDEVRRLLVAAGDAVASAEDAFPTPARLGGLRPAPVSGVALSVAGHARSSTAQDLPQLRGLAWPHES